MGVNIGKLLGLGLKILPHLGTAMEVIETIRGDASGDVKENAAIEALKTSVALVEGAVQADLLDDPKVEKAARDVMKAVKSLTNVIKDTQARRAKAGPSSGS